MYTFHDYINSVFIIQYLCFCFCWYPLLLSSKDKGANYLHFPTDGPQSTNLVLRAGGAPWAFSLCSTSVSPARDITEPQETTLCQPLHSPLTCGAPLLIPVRCSNCIDELKLAVCTLLWMSTAQSKKYHT